MPIHPHTFLLCFAIGALPVGVFGAPDSDNQQGLPNDDQCEANPSFDSRTTTFWSTHVGAPKNEQGKPEFNIYYLFACPNAKSIKRLVLVRMRPSGGPTEDLVGKMELPESAIRKAKQLVTRQGRLNVVSGRCVLFGESNEEVNALVPGTTEGGGEVKPKHVVFAWKVDPAKNVFDEVPSKALRFCVGG